jgi:hypothetical protein
MKKALLILGILGVSMSALAADFTISVQSAGSLKWVAKYNNVVVGTETRDKSLNSFYAHSSGARLPVNVSTNKLALNGDQIWFESSDCTGTPYQAAIYPTLMTNRGVIYKPSALAPVAKNLNSRLSNYEGEDCSQYENPMTVFPLQVCSAQECPFSSNSDLVFSQQ